jgi:hypothetical protein
VREPPSTSWKYGVTTKMKKNSTTNQLTPTPILIPKMRASWMFVRGLIPKW